jgi:hypothetical protein
MFFLISLILQYAGIETSTLASIWNSQINITQTTFWCKTHSRHGIVIMPDLNFTRQLLRFITLNFNITMAIVALILLNNLKTNFTKHSTISTISINIITAYYFVGYIYIHIFWYSRTFLPSCCLAEVSSVINSKFIILLPQDLNLMLSIAYCYLTHNISMHYL